jgi:hypothetical protein
MTANFSTETDHAKGEAVSLYPKEGVELEYRGRVSLHIGSVVINNCVEKLTTHSDVLDLVTQESPNSRRVVASSKDTESLPAVRSIKLM